MTDTTPRNEILREVTIHCSTPERDPIDVAVGHMLPTNDHGTVMLMPAGGGGIEMTPTIARMLAHELTGAAARAEQETRRHAIELPPARRAVLARG